MADLIEIDVVDEAPFFAPAATDMIDGLVGQYDAMRRRIEAVHRAIASDEAAVQYFIGGNANDGRWSAPSVPMLFKLDGAVAALNSTYWGKALALTDVLDSMPQKRRDEWNQTIREQKAPDFEEATVRDTIGGLLASRATFFSERVDGIFRGLSGEHVTNAPEGFGRRMILARALSEYDMPNHSVCGLINDLRAVVAKFMGRDEPHYDASTDLIRGLRGNWGEWVPVDGGALRVRLYKKGTAHLEVHPDMAYRLNQVLAHLYPLAIPPQFRVKPTKRPKDFTMLGKPLPFAVLRVLQSLKEVVEFVNAPDWRRHQRRLANTRSLHMEDKTMRARVEEVLRAIGGVPMDRAGGWQFDYEPSGVLAEIVASGCIPDQRAHQFYPTPEELAQRVVDMAEIEDGHAVLEPSAGQGGIADLLPREQATCVEISPLHCAILRAKGLHTIEADFLSWQPGRTFDRIVMNPPFSEGRARMHVQRAFEMLAPGGRLVAIMPAGERGKDVVPGCEWSQLIDNAFAGTSVSVAILVAQQGAA